VPDFQMQDGYVVTLTEKFLMEAHAARAPVTNAPLLLGSGVRHYNYVVPHDMPATEQIEILDLGLRNASRLRVDFGSRLTKWHEDRLKYQLTLMYGGLDALPVKARRTGAVPPYHLEDGYHRYIASVIMGFPAIPCRVPKPPAPTIYTGGKYIPPHLRNRK
jgi:hypothetical protein